MVFKSLLAEFGDFRSPAYFPIKKRHYKTDFRCQLIPFWIVDFILLLVLRKVWTGVFVDGCLHYGVLTKKGHWLNLDAQMYLRQVSQFIYLVIYFFKVY